MKGILIGNGDFISKEVLESRILRSDLVVAIDGGLNYCREYNIIPDLLIGDLDSISIEGLDFVEENKIPILKYPKEKDFTDMELGIEYLYEKGFSEIIIFGASGTRLDHTLGNIYLLSHIKDLDMEGLIIDRNNEIYLVDSSITLEYRKNSFVSVIPLGGEGARVSLEGFKYPLQSRQIDFSSTLGISNEIVEDKGYINVEEGKILVFISKD